MLPATSAKTRRAINNAGISALGHPVEHFRGQVDASGPQLLAALWADAGGPEAPDHLALLTDAQFLEQEDLLHGDDATFHAGDL